MSTAACPPHLKQFLDDLATRSNDPPFDLNKTDMKSGPKHSGMRSFSIQSISSLLETQGRVSEQTRNPERDSFAYLETLLESLTVLGKLGSALDVVSQRLPSEVYALIDSTIDEVFERAEISRRLSAFSPVVQGRPSSVYVFSSDVDAPSSNMAFVDATTLRLAALESTEKQADHEIIRDLFWTLYSKLDAVTQGLRVVYEVANRIGSVSLDV